VAKRHLLLFSALLSLGLMSAGVRADGGSDDAVPAAPAVAKAKAKPASSHHKKKAVPSCDAPSCQEPPPPPVVGPVHVNAQQPVKK
jgi:hypothetical protein